MKEKTAPWLQIDVNWWPDIADQMPRPWPENAVYMDLRWYADQEAQGRAKRPSRPVLCARWGWTDWKARQALKAENLWQSTNRRPTDDQPATNRKTAPKRVKSQEAASGSHPARIPDSSPRALKQNTENREQNVKTLTSESKKPAPRLGPVRRVFDEIVKIRIEAIPGAQKLEMTRQRGQTLKARIMEHSEDEVLAVVRWWLKSSHPRAGYLRENGHGIDTLLRASNFAKYLEFSREPARAVVTPQAKQAWARTQKPSNREGLPPQTSNRTPEPPKLNAYSVEQIAAVESELAPLKAGCKPETWDRMIRTALEQAHGAA